MSQHTTLSAETDSVTNLGWLAVASVQVALVAGLTYLYWQTRKAAEDRHASSPAEQTV